MADYPRAIFGAGKQAGHILFLLEWMGLPWKDCLLFDDAYPQRKSGARDLPIAGTLQAGIDHCHQNKIPAIVALGTRVAAIRYQAFQKARSAGINLVNLVHPSCVIAPTATIGQNVVMMPNCVICPGTVVGSLACLFSSVTVEHDCRIGDDVVIGPGTALSSFVLVGDHSFLGTGVVCAPEVKIGRAVVVGAGAVVVSDLPAGTVCVGVPARVQRAVQDGDDAPTSAQLQKLGLDDLG
jgi:sugar O-acyltransferase (sialic acid O-acetyltransferase NeuD family)